MRLSHKGAESVQPCRNNLLEEPTMKIIAAKTMIAVAAVLILILAGNRLTAAPNLAPAMQGEHAAKRAETKAETIFNAKYLAYVDRKMPAGQPLAPCDACILQCAQNDLQNCRAACDAVCGLE